MNEQDVKLETSIRDSGFRTLLCAVLGFILLEAWIVRLGGEPVAHTIVVFAGLVLAWLVYRAISRSGTSPATYPHGNGKRDRLPGRDACWAALLAVFGYAGAWVVSSGLLTLFAAFVACAYLFPWSKVPLCRTSILRSMGLIAAATVIGLLTANQLPDSFFFPVAVWMLWMAAICAWLTRIFYRHRKLKAARFIAQWDPVQDEKKPAVL